MAPEESKYDEVVEVLVSALERGASGSGFSFDGEDMPEFQKKLQDRKKIIDALKKKMGGGKIKASEWSPVMVKLDFLSRIDRDLQLRFRSRIGAFRRRLLPGISEIASINSTTNALEEIQKA